MIGRLIVPVSIKSAAEVFVLYLEDMEELDDVDDASLIWSLALCLPLSQPRDSLVSINDSSAGSGCWHLSENSNNGVRSGLGEKCN